MPTFCAHAGCPERVNRGWCNQHQPDRRPRQRQHYDTAAWQTTRQQYRHDHPEAACCGHPTIDVDHIIPRKILLAAGIHNPDDTQWLQPLCRAHHSVKTARVDMPLLRELEAGSNPDTLADAALTANATWLTSLHHRPTA